jgi:hypothetical protein
MDAAFSQPVVVFISLPLVWIVDQAPFIFLNQLFLCNMNAAAERNCDKGLEKSQQQVLFLYSR